MNPVLAITGHRPDKLGGWKIPNPTYIHVCNELKKTFEYYKPSYVIVGMAIGVDQWAAEICMGMNIKYIAAIPFDAQDSKWPDHVKAKYQWLLSRADQKYVISPGTYEPKKMQIRNEWMVNYCQLLVAVWNGTEGGTANCVAYAQRINKPIYFVPCDPPLVLAPIPGQVMQVADNAKAFLKLFGNKPKEVVDQEHKEAVQPFVRKVNLD